LALSVAQRKQLVVLGQCNYISIPALFYTYFEYKRISDIYIYIFGKRLSFKDLNILNDDATATKLGKKKKTLKTTCCCCWDLGQNVNFTYQSKKGKINFLIKIY